MIKATMAALAVTAACVGVAEAQNTHVSVEGGVACSRNRAVVTMDGIAIGNKGCGGTGAVEIGRTGQPVLGVFDHWAIRGRFTSFDQTRDIVVGGSAGSLSFEDSRVVIDAEVGRNLGFGLFGGTSRGTIGLRAGSWDGELAGRITAGPGAGSEASVQLETQMIGVRLGLRSSIPLTSHWMYESNLGFAAMQGRHRAKALEDGVTVDQARASNAVYSIDSSSALSYKFNGADTGLIGSVGLFSEYWFNQTEIGDMKRNRHSWGPFLRARMPLQ
jgi:hypothetical protein